MSQNSFERKKKYFFEHVFCDHIRCNPLKSWCGRIRFSLDSKVRINSPFWIIVKLRISVLIKRILSFKGSDISKVDFSIPQKEMELWQLSFLLIFYFPLVRVHVKILAMARVRTGRLLCAQNYKRKKRHPTHSFVGFHRYKRYAFGN